MNMKEFSDLPEIKFMTVLGKMHGSIFSNIHSHIKALGFNSTEFLILYAIAANGKLTIQDIAARITMTSGNMTYTIDKLEKRGLIKRVRCPEDRRMIFIDMTETGEEAWKIIMVEHTAYMQETFAEVDKEQLLEAIELMKVIGKSIK